MSIVSLLNVQLQNNPAPFTDPYELEITFECLEPLSDDLEWKLIYVGSSASSKYDQELESIMVGPVPVGVNKFLFTADAPSPDLIPQDELVSVTVMLLSCSYRDQEFVQVGYYVNNEYDTEELRENPPSKVALDHVVRNVLAEKPHVTRFNISWDGNPLNEFPPDQPEADLAEDDEDQYGNEEEDYNDEMADLQDAEECEVEGDDDDDEEEDDEEDEDEEDTDEEETENIDGEEDEALANSDSRKTADVSAEADATEGEHQSDSAGGADSANTPP